MIFMKYVIACMLSLSFLLKAGATEIKSVGGPPNKCGWNSGNQDNRPRGYTLRSSVDNRRNYKRYDQARETRTVTEDFMYNNGFIPNEY
jgi:hypothetical protein